MKNRIIAQNTLTHAYKGQAVLAQKGIQAAIVRLSSEQTTRGCAWGLSLAENLLPRAVKSLNEQGAFVGQIL